MCTYTAEAWAQPLKTSCLPISSRLDIPFYDYDPYDDINFGYCATARLQVTDGACVRAACSYILATAWGEGEIYAVGGDMYMTPWYYVELIGHPVDPLGSVQHAHLMQRFVAANLHAPPGPLNAGEDPYVLTVDDYNNGVPFEVPAGALASHLAAAAWNVAFRHTVYFEGERLLDIDVDHRYRAAMYEMADAAIVATPLGCWASNPAFASIAWLGHYNVTWSDLVYQEYTMKPRKGFVAFVMGLDEYLLTESPEEFLYTCTFMMDNPVICDLFGSYYSWESLTNLSVTPSPYVDAMVIAEAMNAEYEDCGPPKGCFGVVTYGPVPVTDAAFVGFTANDFLDADLSCVPTGTLFTHISTCGNFRTTHEDDYDCFLARCSNLVILWSGGIVEMSVGRIVLQSDDAGVSVGTVRAIEMLAKFMQDNLPSEPDEADWPPAQPMSETRTFTPSDYGSTSFATTAMDFARQVATALYNRFVAYRMAPAAVLPDLTYDFERIVYSPSFRCVDLDVVTIPWIRDFSTRLVDVIDLANAMLGADVSLPDFDAANWPATCASMTNITAFCDAFGPYYDVASLRTFTMSPSPYNDLYRLVRTFNEQYALEPSFMDCLGVRLEHPPAVAPVTHPMPPVPPMGLMCTYTTYDWLLGINTSCLPVSSQGGGGGSYDPLDDIDVAYCASARLQDPLSTCVRDACSYLLAAPGGGSGSYRIGSEHFNDPFYYVGLYAHVSDPHGPVQLVHLMQEFIADNHFGPYGPLNTSGSAYEFNVDDYTNSVSFAVPAGELAGELAVAMWNIAFRDSVYFETFNGLASNTNVSYTSPLYEMLDAEIVATPDRDGCLNDLLRDIQWLRHGNVTWSDLVGRSAQMVERKGFVPFVMGLSESQLTKTPDDFRDDCSVTIDKPQICALFGTYYSWASIRNASVLPSPYRDALFIASAINQEYHGCYIPKGCFGVLTNGPEPISGAPLVGFVADDFADANLACTPSGTVGVHINTCLNFRTTLADGYCFLAQCSNLVIPAQGGYIRFAIGRIALLSDDTFPAAGTVRAIEMLTQFMQDNLPTPPNEADWPPAQPMNETRSFYPADFGTASFATSAMHFARQVATALYNRRVAYRMAPSSTSDYLRRDFDRIIYSPSYRCTEPRILSIPWIQDFDTRVVDVLDLANAMLGADVTLPDFDAANWPTTCAGMTSITAFCNAFGPYYDVASLRNFDMSPSPYDDLYRLMRVFNEQYTADPWHMDCLGVRLELPPLAMPPPLSPDW